MSWLTLPPLRGDTAPKTCLWAALGQARKEKGMGSALTHHCLPNRFAWSDTTPGLPSRHLPALPPHTLHREMLHLLFST